MEVIFKTWFYGYKELNTEKDTIGRGVEAKIKKLPDQIRKPQFHSRVVWMFI
jgi:hypothetical protein